MSFSKRYSEQRSKSDADFKEYWHGTQLEREVVSQLISIRTTLGMTQDEFARYIKLEPSTLSQLESGEQNITIKTLQHIINQSEIDVEFKLKFQK